MNKLRSRDFHKTYFLLKEITEADQDQRYDYLHKRYGVLKYPTTKVYSPSDHEDVIYATLGAVRALELENDKCDILFETTAQHILEENGVVDYKTESLSVNANFTPWHRPRRLGALAMCGLAFYLRKIGVTSVQVSTYYKLMSLIPNFKDPMTSMTAHYIIGTCEKDTWFGKAHRFLFRFFAKKPYNKNSQLTKRMIWTL